MATLKIEIELDEVICGTTPKDANDAGAKIAGALRKLSDRLSADGAVDPLFRCTMTVDSNTVGKAYVSHPKKVDSV